MALIHCPECDKEVSDKASSCPNCGFPLETRGGEEREEREELICPDFPDDLSIGKQIINWIGGAALSGYFDAKENLIEGIESGKVHVLLHEDGIRICGSWYTPLIDIHRSQIISLKQTSQLELMQEKKSVIGRAIVGGVITGPLGAIVGGMSGIGHKSKTTTKYYLVVNYWNVINRKPMSILISSYEGVPLFLNSCKSHFGFL